MLRGTSAVLLLMAGTWCAGCGPAAPAGTLAAQQAALEAEQKRMFEELERRLAGPSPLLPTHSMLKSAAGCSWVHEHYDLVFELENLEWMMPSHELWDETVEYVGVYEASFEEIRELALEPTLALHLEPDDLSDFRITNDPRHELTLVSSVIRWRVHPVNGRLPHAFRKLAPELWIAAAEWDGDRAGEVVLASVGLARHATRVPGVMSWLTATSMQSEASDRAALVIAIAPGLLREEHLAPVQSEIEGFDPLADLHGAFEDDLAWETHDMRAWRLMLKLADDAESAEMLRDAELNDLEGLLANYRRLVDAAQWAIEGETFARYTDPGVPMPTRPEGDLWFRPIDAQFVESAMSLQPRLVTNAWLAEMRRRGAIVGLAAERYRLASGRPPTDQAELVSSGLLDRPVRSIFSQAELGIAAEDTGTVVYDPGPDERDDGGGALLEAYEVWPWMTGRRTPPRGDVRVWSTSLEWRLGAEARRLPEPED